MTGIKITVDARHLRKRVAENAARIFAESGESQAVFGRLAWPDLADPGRMVRRMCSGDTWPGDRIVAGFAQAAGIDWRDLYA